MNLCVYMTKDEVPWVHARECSHRKMRREQARGFDIVASTRQEAANAAWADCIAEGSMTPEDALADVVFALCVKGLS